MLDRGGNHLLAVKDSQSNLHDDIRRAFDDPGAKLHSSFDTTDGDHGRVEVRRHRVSHDVSWLNASRRYPGALSFPGVRAIAMVEAEVERDGKTSLERRYHLSSQPLDARLFARAVRCHWQSRTGCTGCSMSCSMRTSADCAPDADRKTWPPSATWP